MLRVEKPALTFQRERSARTDDCRACVAGMRVGEVRKLVVPAALGYGDQGAGDKIPPNATLVFTIELLAINPAS